MTLRAGVADSGVGVMRAVTVNTPNCGMTARAAANSTGGSGAGVIPSRVFESAPTAGRRVGAFVVVVSKQVAVGALGEEVEA